jgi:hypothetical protein
MSAAMRARTPEGAFCQTPHLRCGPLRRSKVNSRNSSRRLRRPKPARGLGTRPYNERGRLGLSRRAGRARRAPHPNPAVTNAAAPALFSYNKQASGGQGGAHLVLDRSAAWERLLVCPPRTLLERPRRWK